MQPLSYLSERVSSFGETIFAEMTALALKHNAVNLGQGFPNFPCPDFIKNTAIQAIQGNVNQYARGMGAPKLVQHLATFYAPLMQRELNPLTEIVVTVGATEALFACCQAFLNPGDEVLLFEPVYDSYPAAVTMAGGVPVYLPLIPDANGCWTFSEEELRRLFNQKTKLIFLNTPHNPTGKVFTQQELQLIAELCIQHNVLAICDEVYEHLLFDGKIHLRLATFPNMWERTITLSSAGKTFSVTGWKIGWAIAPKNLIHGIQQARQWISFSVATPFQDAVADALLYAREIGYYQELAQLYQKKRDLLVQGLAQVGFRPYLSEGTYFVVVDCQAFGDTDDLKFCRYLTSEIGVTAIPPSFFYCEAHKHLARHFARFAFCKDDDTLQQALKRLSRLTLRSS